MDRNLHITFVDLDDGEEIGRLTVFYNMIITPDDMPVIINIPDGKKAEYFTGKGKKIHPPFRAKGSGNIYVLFS